MQVQHTLANYLQLLRSGPYFPLVRHTQYCHTVQDVVPMPSAIVS